MHIEDEIFKKSSLDFKKLIAYGFVQKNDKYLYSKPILDNTFRIDIEVDKKGKVKGKVYDLSFNEEYINHRIEKQTGEFVSTIREFFINTLMDIKDKCAITSYFVSNQANRLAKYIKNTWDDEPKFLWEKFPDYAVFKNPDNEKWYGIIMNINLTKVGGENRDVDILNVKLSEKKVSELLNKKGYYPAYHMNKKTWISILLDDTLADEEIIEYISESHAFTITSNEWIIPSNPKYFDIINCFNEQNTLLWKQSSNMHVGDIVYIYVGSPYSCLLYQCKVLEVNIPYNYKDANLTMSKVMNLKLLKRYKEDEFTFKKLQEYGVNAIRGPRSIPLKLSKELNKKGSV